MLSRFRQSLAFRLAILYSALFIAASAAIFGVLYVALSRSIERRDRAALEARTEDYAQAFEVGGVAGLRNRVAADPSPDGGSLLVRIMDPNGETRYIAAPSSWVDPQAVMHLVPNGWLGWQVEEVHSVRVPLDEARDYAIASRALPGGHLLQVARRTDSRAVLLAPLRRDFAGVGSAVFVLSLIVGTWLAWGTTRPLRLMAATAHRIVVEDDLTARVPTPGGRGELAVLAGQLNALLDKNTEHVRILRETLDHLAHDLRTPLTRLRGTAEIAMAGPSDPKEAQVALLGVVEESDRVLHLLEALLDVSAAEGGALALRKEPVDLRVLAARAIDLYREVAEERKIAVHLEAGPEAPLVADPVRLGQAISNLVDNALKYTPAGGTVTLSVAPGDPSVLTVDDTGPGVPGVERDAIWRRLYRGDASRSQRGLGLGLTLVRAIAEAHGGSAEVDTAPGGGARFVLRVPRGSDPRTGV